MEFVKSIERAYPEYANNPSNKEDNEVLCLRIQNGDKEAETELICRNIRFIQSITRKYYLGEYEEDAFAEACIALIRAAQTYNPEKGSFTTYSYHWVRQHLNRMLANTIMTIRMPVHAFEYMWSYRKIITEHPEYTDEEIMKILDVSEEIYKLVKYYYHYPVASLNQKVHLNDDSDSDEQMYFLCDETIDIEKECIDKVFFETIKESMQKILTEKEYDILFRRAGLHDEHAYTLDEIGKVYGVTRERIRQIEKKAIEKAALFVAV